MNPSLRKVILCIFIGIAATFIDFSIFNVLRRGLGFALLLANTSGVCSGIAVSLFRESQIQLQSA
jgi:hypothetical protein